MFACVQAYLCVGGGGGGVNFCMCVCICVFMYVVFYVCYVLYLLPLVNVPFHFWHLMVPYTYQKSLE